MCLSSLIWAVIFIHGCTNLRIIRKSFLIVRCYKEEHLFTYAGSIGEIFILMDDNCRAHCAEQVTIFSNPPSPAYGSRKPISVISCIID